MCFFLLPQTTGLDENVGLQSVISDVISQKNDMDDWSYDGANGYMVEIMWSYPETLE